MVKMNDAAAGLLDLWGGFGLQGLPGALAPELEGIVADGLSEHEGALVLTDAAPRLRKISPEACQDLTRWECDTNSFHLEDFVGVRIEDRDDEPFIDEAGQRLLLIQGFALALRVCQLSRTLQPPVPVRCIVGANTTNATFRFHRIRPGQQWHHPDLDAYRQEKIVIVDCGGQPS